MADSPAPAPSPLGRSLRLAAGDLIVRDHDLELVTDEDNFLQGAEIIVGTPFGTDVFNVNYGFAFLEALSAAHEVRTIKEILRMNLVKSFANDDRVREVVDVIFDDDPRYAALLSARAGRSAAAAAESLMATLRQQRVATREWQALVLLRLVSGPDTSVAVTGSGAI